MKEFKGVVPATITPFTKDGELNEPMFRKIMEFNIESGVDGFWISGGTGESVLLSESELIRTAEISAELCADRAASIVHVGALTTDSSARMARAAKNAGADAIACVPPFFYHPSDDAVIYHYQAVVEAAELPLFVYNQPKYTGVEFTPALMERVVREVPMVAGVKHSAPDFNNIRRFTDMGLAVFTGSGSLFISALLTGAVGIVDGPLTVAPNLWIGAYRSYQQGEIERAWLYQKKANKLIDLAAKYGMQATCKALSSEVFGEDCGDPRRPIPPLSDADKMALVKAAKQDGLIRALEPVAAGDIGHLSEVCE